MVATFVCEGVKVLDGVNVAVAVRVAVRVGVADFVNVGDFVAVGIFEAVNVGPAGVLVAGSGVLVGVNTAPGVPIIAITKPDPIDIWVMLLRVAGIDGSKTP